MSPSCTKKRAIAGALYTLCALLAAPAINAQTLTPNLVTGYNKSKNLRSPADTLELAQVAGETVSPLVQIMINDMALNNDEALKNHRQFGWARVDLPGFNVSGPNNSRRPYLLPWYTLAEGVSNYAHNVSLEMRNMQTWVLVQNQWRKVHGHERIGGAYFPQSGNYFSNSQGKYSGDAVAIRSRLNLHGWWGGRKATGQVQAVIVAAQARLQGPDAWRAKYLMNIGADWYPNQRGASPIILKSVGISRAKHITPEWQWVTMTTLSNAGVQEPGGGITAEQLNQNPATTRAG